MLLYITNVELIANKIGLVFGSGSNGVPTKKEEKIRIFASAVTQPIVQSPKSVKKPRFIRRLQSKNLQKNRGQREIKSKAASQQQQQIASFAKVLMLIYL